MKKTALLLVILLVSVASYGQSPIFIKGQDRIVDTLEHKQIGPGIIYTRATVPSLPLNFYTLSIDLENAYNKVETFQGQGLTTKTEAMTTAYNRLTTTEQKSLAAINGNFWIVSGQGQDNRLLGVPHSGSVRNGEMITDPNEWNRGHGAIGFAAIDESRKLWIDDMNFDGSVTIEGVGSYNISEINRIRKTNELVFFNDYTATTRTEDDGIEVFIKPISGQSWKVNQSVECEVVRIVKDKGANVVPAGQSVLSGVGAARTFLENLEVGAKLKVNMGIYTIADKLRPLVTQMITGNGLVMKNGILTDRNTNEAYNSQPYPRTGIGASPDGKKIMLIVIDKRGTSVGASTETMCEILKASGSVDATSLDGGGSAQMMLGGKIINNPADGKERPVANGWMLFSTAPQTDNVVTEIKFSDYKVSVPSLASYKPTILAYNKYGALVSENLEEVKLSCDPSLGEITKEGSTFVATAGAGLLTADYKGIKATKQIAVVEGEIVMRLKSVVIDNNFEYPIEVYSVVGNNTYYYDPASIDWEVEDASVCVVEDGVLKGIKAGETSVKGTLGDFTTSIEVKVQIPENYSVIFDDEYASDWTLNSISSVTNKVLEKTATGVNYKFNYASGRYPYVEMRKSVPLHALPDSLKLTVNTDIPLSSAIVRFSASNSISVLTVTTPAIKSGSSYQITIPFDQYMNVNDIGVFPIKLTSLYFEIEAKGVSNNDYTIDISDFSLIYNYLKGSSIEEETTNSNRISFYPNPIVDGRVHLLVGDIEASSVEVEIYNVSGQLLQKETLDRTGDVLSMDVKTLTTGFYLLKLECDGAIKTAKLIVK